MEKAITNSFEVAQFIPPPAFPLRHSYIPAPSSKTGLRISGVRWIIIYYLIYIAKLDRVGSTDNRPLHHLAPPFV